MPDISGDPYYLRIAFPRFVAQPSQVAYARIYTVKGNLPARTDLVEDITAIAKKILMTGLERIRAKAIGRAVVKFTTAQTAKKAAAKKIRKGCRYYSWRFA